MTRTKGWFGSILWPRLKVDLGPHYETDLKADLGQHDINNIRLIWVYIMVMTEGWFGSMLWHRPLVDLCQHYISSKSRQRLTQISALEDILRCKSWPLNFLGLCKLLYTFLGSALGPNDLGQLILRWPQRILETG